MIKKNMLNVILAKSRKIKAAAQYNLSEKATSPENSDEKPKKSMKH